MAVPDEHSEPQGRAEGDSRDPLKPGSSASLYNRLFPKRRKPWAKGTVAVAGVAVLGGLLALWLKPAAKIPSSGGLWFPKEVRIDLPHFAQGDSRWGEDLLGATEATLHAEGCALASAAMVLAGYGMKLDPGVLNRFLQFHPMGYTPEGWIYWEAAADFEPGLTEKLYEDRPSRARIDWNLLRGNPVIVRIQMPSNKHFVVIAGKRGWDYLVLDPGGRSRDGLVPLKEIAAEIEALRYYRKPGTAGN